MNRALASSLALVAASCASAPRPGDPAPRTGDEIVVCGERFHIGTPVVLWTDPGGYDAYRVEPRFPAELDAAALAAWKTEAHYDSLRRNIPAAEQARFVASGIAVADLARHVDLFVVHYDACGSSRRCFQVLQDERHLSVHFMLDVDGTIYQTLDVKERAWHATMANDRSIGVEIAQIGAFPAADDPALVAQPAREALVTGTIHGTPLWQHDFTDAQYRALGKLAAALHRILPRIALDAPRDAHGMVLERVLSNDEFAAFSGVLGHYHVQENKIDPGPAFDWQRVLDAARAEAGE